jgi:hypothetical protein
MKLFYMLTGGRPMKRIRHAFTDIVVGKPVYEFKDRFGRRFLAYNCWAWFRVSLDEE